MFIFQDIELNKAQWSSLFEPYLFFEAYKNYLQVDIIAADLDDILAWKGWVESQLRQLTLKVKSLIVEGKMGILYFSFQYLSIHTG